MNDHLKLALLVDGEYVPGAHSLTIGEMGPVTAEAPRLPTLIHCDTSRGRFEMDLTADQPNTRRLRDWIAAHGWPGMKVDIDWDPPMPDGADSRQRRRVMRRHGQLRREIRAAKWTVVR